MTIKLTIIDQINRQDHSYLDPGDNVAFFYEYTARENWSHGKGNQLIFNLKKSPILRGQGQYFYKGQAIREAGSALSGALNSDWLKSGTIVPVPSSKAHNHAEYDDRMLQICKLVQRPFPVDVRELVITTGSREAMHRMDARLNVDQLAATFRINEACSKPDPTDIVVVDDVLTSGTHFKAMERVLKARFPYVSVSGIFIARRVVPNPFGVVTLPATRT